MFAAVLLESGEKPPVHVTVRDLGKRGGSRSEDPFASTANHDEKIRMILGVSAHPDLQIVKRVTNQGDLYQVEAEEGESNTLAYNFLQADVDSKAGQGEKNSAAEAEEVAAGAAEKAEGSFFPKGRCLLVDASDPRRVPKTTLEFFKTLYKKKLKTKRGEQHRPKRPKRAIDFFVSDFHKNRRRVEGGAGKKGSTGFADINAEAIDRWRGMNAGEKAKYFALAEKEKQRYQEETAAYRALYPPERKPPKRRLSAYNIYCRANKTVAGHNWKTLTPEEKAHFNALSEQDKLRYDEEVADFKAWCVEEGRDFEKLLTSAKKKRKRKQEKAELKN